MNKQLISAKQNTRLTIVCTFDETDSKTLDRVYSQRNRNLVEMAYRAICKGFQKSPVSAPAICGQLSH